MRPDFWVQSANKQLNFIQHFVALLKPGGRAAVVVPDNVLFESGAAASVRRRLLETCRVHTILRLPPGLFYALGVKADVIFFDKPTKTGQVATQSVWIYKLRSDKRFSLRTKPLQGEDLQEFVALYADPDRSSGQRHRSFEAADVLAGPDCRLDLTWSDPTLRGRTPGLARLDELSRLVADDLQCALALIAQLPKP